MTDWSGARPWLQPLTCGVRRDMWWSAPYLRRMRLDFWLVYWNPSPGATLTSDGVEHPLDRDVLLLVPPGSWICRRQVSPFDHWWCHVRTAATPSPANATRLAATGTLGRLLRRSWSTAWARGSRHPASLLACHAVLAEALGQLPWPAPDQVIPTDHAIAALQAWLLAQGCPALDNSALARRLGMHPKSLVRRFTRAVGTAPQTWLRDQRLDLAAERLSAGMTIEEAADAGAFTDRFHLGRLFRRRFGIGPGGYRRMSHVGVGARGVSPA